MTARACERCLVRPWLLGRLASHLDVARGRVGLVLGLSDEEMVAALGGAQRSALLRELERFDAGPARERAREAGLELICRCDPAYPARLAELPRPPAVLHIAGGLDRFLGLLRTPAVAIVGARRPSGYGLEMASSLGRGLGAAGAIVLSGMALGIDSAVHAGALAASAPTIAVLPAGAERAYPASKRALARRIKALGALVSELPPGTSVRRWMFPTRNRIIAALAAMTVVVEAGEGSGALITAAIARELGRPVGAVPGRVGSTLASGPNALLAAGGVLVTGPHEILDELFGVGMRDAPAQPERAELAPEQRQLLDAIGDGANTVGELARAGFAVERALTALAALELAGYVRRQPGGRFTPVA